MYNIKYISKYLIYFFQNWGVVAILLLASLHFFKAIDLFQAGVRFCKRMAAFHKSTYAESCVIWCVLFPLVVTIGLIALPGREKMVGRV